MVTCSGLSDFELVALLQSGDSAACKEIYGRHSVLLLNHAYNKTRDREEVKILYPKCLPNCGQTIKITSHRRIKNQKDIFPGNRIPNSGDRHKLQAINN